MLKFDVLLYFQMMGIMKDNKVAVNDLYTFAKPRLKKIQRKVNVHFTRAGSQALGDQVVAAIKKAMSSKAEKTEK